MISPVIHQFWDKQKMPERFREFMRTFQEFNPEYEMVLWTPQRICSDPGFVRIHDFMQDDRLPSTIKSDLFRYNVLYLYGGFYADTDCECLRPLDDLRTTPFVVGWEREEDTLRLKKFVEAHFLGSFPWHPLGNATLDMCIENVRMRYVNGKPVFENVWDLLYTSGPQMFQKVIERYCVTPLSQNCFTPFAYQSRPSTAELLALPGPAYVFHHFAGLQPGGWTTAPNFTPS